MTTPNIPMLRKAVEWVEWQDELPDIDREWGQEHYRISAEHHARHLVYQAMDHHHHHYANLVAVIDHYANLVAPHCGSTYCVAGYIAILVDRRFAERDVVDGLHPCDVAMEALGIDREQAGMLFNGGNDAVEVRRVCEQIAGQRL